MQYCVLGRTGYKVSLITYGGIVSMDESQAASDCFVAEAIDRGINYFDVAPSYGDAEARLGPSLAPYRQDVYLACKTLMRDFKGAEAEFERSLKLLKTDYFDNYQLHSVTTVDDVAQIFAPGGAMELLVKLKDKGLVRKLGVTAHNETAALACLDQYPFDTVMFPFNWMLDEGQGIGRRLKERAKKDNIGLLGLKALILRAWNDEDERKASVYPKSWCLPIAADDRALRIAACRKALTLGPDTLIPPGNHECFRFMADHADEISKPLTAEDEALLAAQYPAIKDRPFFARDNGNWPEDK